MLGDANRSIRRLHQHDSVRAHRERPARLAQRRIILDLTKQLWDDGNARDYDDPSPVSGQTLGQFRVNAFNSGNNVVYVDNGSYVKLREVTVSFEARGDRRARASARPSHLLQGRNLAIWTKYWGSIPNSSGDRARSTRAIRDVAEYPSSKQFHISFDFGY